ncbi:AraC family transcriptional regulator [Paenibacillus spongiae]|uniref:AraC family transcriptional regulator n=1 Tax=Paenibacillus spongiae TaxID=2909671 RepID=A0ABY5S4F2_9BACL|nr:AraC family transcriptional regulator [Paenibacillus spongiae]UVI28779.1 AraC family transcriptional regulator [Paenibacillus spongiae]
MYNRRMKISSLNPYVYYATRYPFSKGQSSAPRICYGSSLYLISEGHGVIHTCGRTHKTRPGSLVYIPPGQIHEWIADDRDPMVHICCYFDWHFVDRQARFETPSSICYDFPQLHTDMIGPSFYYPIPEHSTVERIRVWTELFEGFYTANEYVSERTMMRNLKVQSRFQGFIEHFLSFTLNEAQIPDPRMDKLLERLDQDLMRGRPEPLEHYYEDLKISRGYFFELFKHATGMSPIQYMNRFRINRAKYDLRNSQLSVTEIAEKHDFSSVHYFSRLFHQITGASPLQYRRGQE